MTLMSALGWVARTVLISGSSTGLIPPPRGAPRRASRRRTPAPPPLDGAGVAAAGAGAAGGAGLVAAGRARARCGAAASRATSVSFPETGDSSGPGADWVTSAAAVPVVATSPATCAPVVRPGNQSIGACQSGLLVAARGQQQRVCPGPVFPRRYGAPGWPGADDGPGTPGGAGHRWQAGAPLTGRAPPGGPGALAVSERHERAQRLPGELAAATEEREFHDDGHTDD